MSRSKRSKRRTGKGDLRIGNDAKCARGTKRRERGLGEEEEGGASAPP